MANFVNKYNDMTAYNADSTKQYPNTSKVVSEGKVLFQREDPADLTRLIVTYDVTSTENPTTLLGTGGTSVFTEQIIDGVVQPSVVSSYTFSTIGEHVVKYQVTQYLSTGFEAFNQCSSVVAVVIGNGVTSVARSSFAGAYNLVKVNSDVVGECNIPNSITAIGINGFSGCIGLTSITIPDSVTSISDYAFSVPRLIGVTNITVGTGVTSIGDGAFRCNNTDTTQCNFTIYATVPPTLGTNVFRNKYNLTIYVPAESLTAYQTAWSAYADRIQAIPNP